MTLCQTLQSGQSRRHLQVIGIRLQMLRHLLYHKRAHASAVEVVNIAVAVVPLRMQGKEQRLLRETQ